MSILSKQALAEYAVLASMCKEATLPGKEFKELVRLAQIGLWAEEYAIPFMKDFEPLLDKKLFEDLK